MTEIDLKKRERKKLLLFNEAIEYLDKSDTIYELKDSNINQTENYNSKSNLLRDQMLEELNNLRDLIANNPDLKFKALSDEERNFFYDFINHYSICPICGAFNHYYHLKRFYFNENNTAIKEKLITLMNLKNKKLQEFNLNFGIPCCTCFKKILKGDNY